MSPRTAHWSPPFLTLVDPEIAVKGSIDPLGLMPLWSRYGRMLVGNLTTVTDSVRGFTTLLLGLHIARCAVDEGRGDEAEVVEHFLRFEQLAAYSRHAYAEETGDTSATIRGIQRVRARWSEGRGRVSISSGRDGQLLANQKAYGLWALYSAAARESGLIETREPRLTPVAERFVRDVLLDGLSADGLRDEGAILRLATADGTFAPLGRQAKVGRALARIHEPRFDDVERAFWVEHLLFGGPSSAKDRQARFWRAVERVDDDAGGGASWDASFGMAELRECVLAAHEQGDEDVADRLERIRRFEQLIGPCRRAFAFLQNCDGRELVEVVADLRTAWGRGLRHLEVDATAEHLEPVAEIHGDGGVARFARLASALRDGRFESAVDALLEQNAEVMERRGGGPWIAIEAGRTKVRYRSESGALPPLDEVVDLWTNSYFLDAVKSIGRELFERGVDR